MRDGKIMFPSIYFLQGVIGSCCLILALDTLWMLPSIIRIVQLTRNQIAKQSVFWLIFFLKIIFGITRKFIFTHEASITSPTKQIVNRYKITIAPMSLSKLHQIITLQHDKGYSERFQQESPPAWTQETYRPRRIKFSICCPVPGGTPCRGVPLLGGTPSLGGGGAPARGCLLLPGGTPSLVIIMLTNWYFAG